MLHSNLKVFILKVKRDKKQEFTSVSIPTRLFKKVEDHISGTGFPSVSGYVAFILRLVLSENIREEKTKLDYEAGLIKKKLEALGY